MAQVAGAPEWVLIDVEEMTDTTGKIEFWVFVYEVPESVSPDRRHRHGVPKGALEGRAAEYGLTDVDEVLDILIHEPLLAACHASGALPPVIPARMDPASARELIRGQIEWCRREHAAVTRPAAKARDRAADPLQIIRDRTQLDPVVVATIRLEIDRHRLSS